MVEQFRSNLASAGTPSSKWKPIVVSAGLQLSVLPSSTEFQTLDVFPSERSAAIDKLVDKFGEHFAAQRRAHQILSDPVKETIAKWVAKHTPQIQTAEHGKQLVGVAGQAAEKASAVPLHEWWATLVTQEKMEQPLSEAQLKELTAKLNAHFSNLACHAYVQPSAGEVGNIFVKNFDAKSTIQKANLVREGTGSCKLPLWGRVVTETVAKRLPRNTTMYLGDGGKNVPLYLDGSGEVAQNSRCCIGFLIPPLPKEKDVAEASQDASTQPAKKMKTERAKHIATHEISCEPMTIETSAGSFTFQVPILVDAAAFDEETFNTVNKGVCFRKRTAFDDHQFPQEGKITKAAPSFLS